MVIQAPRGTNTQVQTWTAEPPYTLTGSGTGEVGAQYTYCFPHEVQYVVEEVNGNQSYLVTFTSTSTRTSVFSNIPYATQSALHASETPSSALDSEALSPNGNTLVTPVSDAIFTTGLNPSLDSSFKITASSHKDQSGEASLESELVGTSPLTTFASLNSTFSTSFNSLQSEATSISSLINSPSIITTLMTSYTGASLSSMFSDGVSLTINAASGSFSSSVSVFDDAIPSSSVSKLSTASTEANASGSPTSPVVSPNITSDPERNFQLYIKNNVSSLNQLAVGKSGDGQLVVGGVVEATILSINESTNLIDLDGNLVYFQPKNRRSSSRFIKRQNDDPTLRYAKNPPINAVISGFSLQNITLTANTTEGDFTFYTCSENPAAQPIFVVEVGKSPGRCFTFDLVTIPPPLNNTETASSSTAFDYADQTSEDTAASTTTADLTWKLSGTTDFSSTSRFGTPLEGTSQDSLAFNTEISNTEVSSTLINEAPSTLIDRSSSASNIEASFVSNTEASSASNNEALSASNDEALSASSKEALYVTNSEASPTLNTEASSAPTTEISSAPTTGASSAPIIGASSASNKVTIGQLSSSDTLSTAFPIEPSPSDLPSETSGMMAETTGNVVSPRLSTTLASSIIDYTSVGSTNDSAIPTISDKGGISSENSGKSSSNDLPLSGSDIETRTNSSSTSLSTPFNTPAPVIVENQGNYVNQGLYYDTSDSEILDVASVSRISESMSVGSCASFCSQYVYFGLLNGNHDRGQGYFGKANDA